jgi:hypothetical protein
MTGEPDLSLAALLPNMERQVYPNAIARKAEVCDTERRVGALSEPQQAHAVVRPRDRLGPGRRLTPTGLLAKP